MDNIICYEHPLNERIRTFLRLDHLFQQFNHAVAGHSVWDSRLALSSLFDLLEVISRNELKAELIKELERQSSVFKRYQDSPGVDSTALNEALDEIKRVNTKIKPFSSLTLDVYRQQDLLNTVRQRSAIPGGTCAFDLPELHHWLHHTDYAQRQADLTTWLEPIQALYQGINLVLKLIRGSNMPRSRTATEGLYQQLLDSSSTSVQMLRIIVSVNLPVFPEVSGNHHRFAIRFLQHSGNASQKTSLYPEPLTFDLACCAL
jgi:cell division protein ZapD